MTLSGHDGLKYSANFVLMVQFEEHLAQQYMKFYENL